MDARKIEAFLDRYRSLTPDAIALLDEDRHKLTGEEAAALDRVMHEPEKKQLIDVAIAQLDLMKRRSFRLFILEFLAYAFGTERITIFAGPHSREAYAALWLAILLYIWLLRPRFLRLVARDIGAMAEGGRKL
jgi:hypothetical protein